MLQNLADLPHDLDLDELALYLHIDLEMLRSIHSTHYLNP